MKLSELVIALESLKEVAGDLHIWRIDELDYPNPRTLTFELTPTLKKGKDGFGWNGGKIENFKEYRMGFEYAQGDVVDHDITEMS